MRRKIEYIHDQPGWPEFTWDDHSLTAILAASRHKQGRLLGMMESLGFELQTEASLGILTRNVVTTSAIEGERLNPGEVRSSIARRLGLDVAGLPQPGRDVEGVVEMMLDATRQYAAPLTKERLWAWHAALFPTGHSGISRIPVGAWRTGESGPMQVVSGPVGKETVHFQAPHAGRVDSEIERFLRWFETPTTPDPVLKAGVAHLWFVTIHPFEDGNGRIARAIADMCLARADASTQRFYSMTSQIEAERKEYYRNLETAQRGGLDITGWLEWFLGCFDRSLHSAEQGLAAVLDKAELWNRINRRPVNDRQRLVINRMLDDFKGFLTTSKYAKLAKCSSDTALRDIRELLDRHIVLRNPGRGRSTSYRLASAQDVDK